MNFCTTLRRIVNPVRKISFPNEVKLTGSTSKPCGFTIIELIMVVTIVALVASVIAPIYAQRGQALALERSANLLAQNFRAAIEKALASSELVAGGQKVIPRGGYGLYIGGTFANPVIFLFADCNTDKSYTPGFAICNNSAPEKMGDDIALENRVVLQSINPTFPLQVVFQPPDPLVFINGTQNSRAEISLYHTFDPSRIKKVMVESTGLVDVE